MSHRLRLCLTITVLLISLFGCKGKNILTLEGVVKPFNSTIDIPILFSATCNGEVIFENSQTCNTKIDYDGKKWEDVECYFFMDNSVVCQPAINEVGQKIIVLIDSEYESGNNGSVTFSNEYGKVEVLMLDIERK